VTNLDNEPSFMEARGIAAAPASDHPGPRFAARMVELGCYVHPLKRGSKKPATEHGLTDAALDASQITSNYGVAAGASQLVMIDLDDYVEGNRTADFIRDFLDGHKTWAMRTGSGGQQWWYRAPAGVKLINKRDFLGYKGVDIRAGGGYAVGPGCKLHESERKPGATGDGVYRWMPDSARDFAPLPAALEEKLAEVSAPKIDADVMPLENVKPEWITATLQGISADLEESHAWPEGYTDVLGRGWEKLCADKAFELAGMALDGMLELDDAKRTYFAHAPRDSSLDDAWHAAKWASQVRAAGDKPEARKRPKPIVDLESWLDAYPKPPAADRAAEDGIEHDGPARAVAHGDSQFSIEFSIKGCYKVDDEGKPTGAILPHTTAKRLASSWPIAKQALTSGRTWWAYRDGVWSQNDQIVRLSLARSAEDHYQTHHVPAVEDVLSTMVPEIAIEPHPDYINFRNGMLDWRSGELHQHDPEYLSTVQLPHRWNAGEDSPKFDQWLSERLPAEGIQLAWELIAISLYSGNPIQRAGLLYGVGKSGKSTFLEVIQGLIGRKNCCSLAPQGMSKTVFATHSLLGKQSNIVTDIDPTKVSETAVFKQVVASEMIPAQQKNKPEFVFAPFCNHLFSANQIPRASDRTSAWTRRFAILRFDHTIGEEIRIRERYDRLLLEEAEGIIAKAISHLPALLAQGDFSVVTADQEEFESATDFTRDFWEDAIELTGNPDDFSSTTQLAQAFDMWCSANRVRNPPPFTDVELRLRDNPLIEKSRRRPPGAPRTAAALRGWKGVHILEGYRMLTTHGDAGWMDASTVHPD
jgi:P4 family phage/plasmid primase-like protien